jgi:hypothetical protein
MTGLFSASITSPDSPHRTAGEIIRRYMGNGPTISKFGASDGSVPKSGDMCALLKNEGIRVCGG